MKKLLTLILCSALTLLGADIDVYQTNGTKAKKTISGNATLSTAGVIAVTGGTATTAATLTPGRTIGITGDGTWTSPVFDGSGNITAAIAVTRLNGISLAGLATGILKNTTATGVPSIAVAGDFPTLNQNTSGSAGTLSPGRTINGVAFDGSANIITLGLSIFGVGSDGAIAGGAGTTTMTRDMYYTNVTLTAGDKLITQGWRVFISGTLDISAADTRAILHTAIGGMNGGDASAGTAGAIPTQAGVGTTLGLLSRGLAGKAGTTGAGTAGTAGAAANPGNGGTGGAAGAGGTGVAGTVAGGALAAGGAVSNPVPFLRIETNFTKGSNLIVGGAGGASGGSGGGVVGGSGGSGGSGSGGSICAIFASTINRGGSTPASCIDFTGGSGGAGGNSPTATAGGGGGSGGGGGGWIQIVAGSLTGSSATNALDASGGNGGVGGTGNTTGNGGNGGSGGNGGRIVLINISAGTVTVLDNTASTGGAGGTTANTTGGTAGTGLSTKMSL